MKILLVEDEMQTAGRLRKGLLENGFAVDVASRSAASAMASRARYDLLILDVQSGLPHLSHLRSIGGPAPVLLLGNPAGSESDIGPSLPDRCLRKPFGFSEFLSQVRLLLPRPHTGNPLTLRIADLEIDLERHRTTRAGQRIDLTPKEFLLLCLLVRNEGNVLSRSLIADQIWDINFESHTNFVDVHIRRLRSKVDDPFPTHLIHTVRGSGYVAEDRTARAAT